ncbi:RluA family pseudouridine synthase [Bdellovibrionota bacterium FG-2]
MKQSDEYLDDSYVVTLIVAEKQSGIRLDHFLKLHHRKRSREKVQKAIFEGSISIERRELSTFAIGKLKPSLQLLSGDRVYVVSEKRPEPEVSFDYRIIFEDDHLLVLDKPGNLPVHPAGRYFFNTLLVHLRTYGHRPNLPADREYFLPHRIDKETSGILVLTKNRDSCAMLVSQFAKRQTKKRYLAIVHGTPPESFVIDAALDRSTHSAISVKMEVQKEGGQASLTEFRRLGVYGLFSLVECFPKTGRQHQIRVHLEHAGHPIVGDKLYGMPENESLNYFERKQLTPEALARLMIPRHALHAAGICFEHPITGLEVSFASGLPPDLALFLSTSLANAHPT